MFHGNLEPVDRLLGSYRRVGLLMKESLFTLAINALSSVDRQDKDRVQKLRRYIEQIPFRTAVVLGGNLWSSNNENGLKQTAYMFCPDMTGAMTAYAAVADDCPAYVFRDRQLVDAIYNSRLDRLLLTELHLPVIRFMVQLPGMYTLPDVRPFDCVIFSIGHTEVDSDEENFAEVRVLGQRSKPGGTFISTVLVDSTSIRVCPDLPIPLPSRSTMAGTGAIMKGRSITDSLLPGKFPQDRIRNNVFMFALKLGLFLSLPEVCLVPSNRNYKKVRAMNNGVPVVKELVIVECAETMRRGCFKRVAPSGEHCFTWYVP